MTDPRVAAIEKRLSEATQPVIRDNWKPVAPPATKEVSDMQKRDESAFREQCQRKGVDICTKEVIEPEIAAPVSEIAPFHFAPTQEDFHCVQNSDPRTVGMLAACFYSANRQLREAQEEIAHYKAAPFHTRNLFENDGQMVGKSFAEVTEEDFRGLFEYSNDCKCQGCAEIRYLLELRTRISILEGSK